MCTSDLVWNKYYLLVIVQNSSWTITKVQHSFVLPLNNHVHLFCTHRHPVTLELVTIFARLKFLRLLLGFWLMAHPPQTQRQALSTAKLFSGHSVWHSSEMKLSLCCCFRHYCRLTVFHCLHLRLPPGFQGFPPSFCLFLSSNFPFPTSCPPCSFLFFR